MPKEIGPFRADLAPVVVTLPTEDRQRSFNIYTEGLGLEPIGEASEDGIPEPPQSRPAGSRTAAGPPTASTTT